MLSILQETNQTLISQEIPTPLGTMIAIATVESLIFLGFSDQKNIGSDLRPINATVTSGTNKLLNKVQIQLYEYFKGTRTHFTIPLTMQGTPFRKQVWQSLLSIPYGQTRSYQEQATAINRRLAVRAVANANGRNPICIIIPCHRVIGSDGSLTGYGAGLPRKQWLINHEQPLSIKANNFPQHALV